MPSICRVCKKQLQLDSFYSYKTSNGLGVCKKCHSSLNSETVKKQKALKEPHKYKFCTNCLKHYCFYSCGKYRVEVDKWVHNCRYCKSDKIENITQGGIPLISSLKNTKVNLES